MIFRNGFHNTHLRQKMKRKQIKVDHFPNDCMQINSRDADEKASNELAN